MSIKVMTEIWDRLNVSGGELNLALALADKGNDKGESIFPGVDLMCRLTRQSRATVQRQLAHFREIEWLQVVQEGGLAGGRGQPTVYRINPEWIAGASLPKLPDIETPEEMEKGLKLRPFIDPKGPHSHEAVSDGKGPHSEQERASNTTEKGLTAMRPDPSGSVIKPLSDGPRASPTGSRAALAVERAEYDLAARINHWRRRAGAWVVGECSALQIVRGRPSIWQELPEHIRKAMAPKLERIVNDLAEFERSEPKVKYETLEQKLQDAITLQLREFKPATPAEISSDRAAMR